MKESAAITDINIVHKDDKPVSCVVCDKLGQVRVYDLATFGKIFRLEGIGSPEDAEHLRGLELSVAEDELPPLDEEDEFYVRDLLGLGLGGGEGGAVGTLVDVIPTGGNDVYVVRGPEGERLVPAVRSFVASVDLDEGRIRLAEDALVDLPVTRTGEEL